jgi:small conductance mechanosensitive channel
MGVMAQATAFLTLPPMTCVLLLDLTRDDFGEWISDHGTAVFGTLILAFVIAAVVRYVVPHAMRPAVERQMSGRPDVEVARRVGTLAGVIVRTAQIVIMTLALFTILPEFGFDIRAVLAGVSITSIAVGFGAQSLVRDTLNGIFILVENQYAVGDIVTITGVTGTVEDVTLRRTVLRDFDGVVYTVPNGSVIVAANFTRDAPRVRVSIPVHATSDLAAVRRIVDEAGEALSRDPEYAGRITDAPHYVGVDSIDMNGVAVQVNGAVRPGSQRDIAVVLRARLLEAFQREGIKTPWG